eukprot:TRINITY_DN278_c4_g1_i1.p1 TRINITY_DN278_c4_g1~~TRINITY_DN278_c4_g1_i1.p1  ORF type:complete len:474 (+),score=92.64 TRINITY_DN278_c4_g1_i1:152-1573(+)
MSFQKLILLICVVVCVGEWHSTDISEVVISTSQQEQSSVVSCVLDDDRIVVGWSNTSSGIYIAVVDSEIDSVAKIHITETTSTPAIAGLANGDIIVAYTAEPNIFIHTVANNSLKGDPIKFVAMAKLPPKLIVTQTQFLIYWDYFTGIAISMFTNDAKLVHRQNYFDLKLLQAEATWDEKHSTYPMIGLTGNEVRYSTVDFSSNPVQETAATSEGNVTFEKPLLAVGRDSILMVWLQVNKDIIELHSTSDSTLSVRTSSIVCNTTEISDPISLTLANNNLLTTGDDVTNAFVIGWVQLSTVTCQFFASDATPTNRITIEVTLGFNNSDRVHMVLKSKETNKLTIVLLNSFFVSVVEYEYDHSSGNSSTVTLLPSGTPTVTFTPTLSIDPSTELKTPTPFSDNTSKITPSPFIADTLSSDVMLVVSISLFCLLWTFKLVRYLCRKQQDNDEEVEEIKESDENELEVVIPDDDIT